MKLTRSAGLIERKYWQYFIPQAATMAGVSFAIIADSVIVGRMIGAQALAAVALAIPVAMSSMALGTLLSLGGALVIASDKGARRAGEADEIFTSALAGGVVLGFVLSLFLHVFLDKTVAVLCPDAAVASLLRDYLKFYAWFPLVMIPLEVVSKAMEADGFTKSACAANVVANGLNLAGDVLFIGPLGMGIAGAAMATVAGYLCGYAFVIFYALAPARSLHFNLRLFSSPRRAFRRSCEIVKNGMPAAVCSALQGAQGFVMNRAALAAGGSSAMLAFSICTNVSMLTMIFIYSSAASLAPLAAALYAERDFTAVRFAARRAVLMSAMCGALLTLLVTAFPVHILRLFNAADAEFLGLGVYALRVWALTYPLMGLAQVAFFYYMAAGRSRLSAKISLLQDFFVLAPLTIAMSRLFGVKGFCWARPLSDVLILAAISFMIRRAQGPEARGTLLLPSGDADRIDFSMAAVSDEAVSAAEQTQRELESRGVKKTLAARVALAVEEMCVNISRYGYKRGAKNFIDVRLRLTVSEITIVVRDDDAFFNPIEYRDDEKDEYEIGGIQLIRALSKSMKYDRIMGMNNTTITIGR